MRLRRKVLSRAVSAAIVAIGARSALAQYEVPITTYAAPGTYYNTATGTGSTLKANLNAIIDGHTLMTYSGTAHNAAMLKLEEDPNNSNNVLLVYSGYSVAKNLVLNSTYNREHLWPNSYGLDDTNHAYSDLFNLRVCEAGVNSDRSNEYFANVPIAIRQVGNDQAPETWEDTSNTMWEPRPVEKGDIARAMFYMDTRYSGDASDNFPRDLVLTSDIGSISSTADNMGRLDHMLQWHYQDGVSNLERRKNHLIYTSDTGPDGWNGTARNQGNRNPFIDHPEYVWAIFGGADNNSQIHVGASANADGSSSSSVNLRVMKNGAMPSANVTINKSNLHPTTYDLTATSNVTAAADIFGPGQAFDYNAQSRNIAVSLNDSTATTGLKTGTITIDNTDLTSAATGQGSADGNDTITLNAAVVDNRVITASTAAFGRVIIGSNATTGTTLNSPGSDNSNTRVTVKSNASSADGNGVFITAGSDTLFNGTTTTANRTLESNFATVGAKSGSRSFVVQGEGLAGEAVNGVSVSYTATAVTHSNGSFLSPSDSDARTIDFGYVPVGFLRSANFLVRNLQTNPGFTAALDIDSVTPGSDAAQFTNSVAPTGLSPIAGGASATYTVGSTVSTAGTLNATWTLGVSDEDIPGATTGTSMVLTATGRFISTATFPVSGALSLLSGETWNTGDFAIQSGAAVTRTGLGTLNIDGTQTHGTGAFLGVASGTVNMNTDAGSASNAPLTVSLGGSGVANFNVKQHLRSFLVAGPGVQVNAAADIVVNETFLHTAGQLDLLDNKMIVRNGDLADITAKLASGRNGGNWDGQGIITSLTQADGPAALTTLAVATASDVLHISGSATATWFGETVGSADTLIRYTYGGDANLSGHIDADDYFQINSNHGKSGLGFFRGDFDYNGVVNADDYFIIDSSFQSQTGPISAAVALSAVTAVPEPSVPSLFVLAGAFLSRRRSRPQSGSTARGC